MQDLLPLTGVRVIACGVVVCGHVAAYSALATSSWKWYNIFENQYWPNVACGPAAGFAMNCFLVTSSILAVSSLIPRFDTPSPLEPRKYWRRRVKRIVPAYYMTMAFNLLSPILLTLGNQTHEARELAMNLQGPKLRDAWPSMLFITNILGQVPVGGHTWNVPLQMQLYAVLPLALLAMRPGISGFRTRLACTCLACIAFSTLYQASVVIRENLMWPIPEQAAFNQGASAGHDPESVRMARTYFVSLYMSFIARMTDFAAGILVYLILAFPAATRCLKTNHRTCSCISVAVLAILAYMCFGGQVALRPAADPATPLMLRIGMLVGVKGLWCPLSTAWLLLQLMLQSDNATRHLAQFLSTPMWTAISNHTYSVFLLHPLVLVWVFQTVDVTVLIGPLHHLPTYASLCLATLVVSSVAGSVQDKVAAIVQ